jgi:hypothetical protein
MPVTTWLDDHVSAHGSLPGPVGEDGAVSLLEPIANQANVIWRTVGRRRPKAVALSGSTARPGSSRSHVAACYPAGGGERATGETVRRPARILELFGSSGTNVQVIVRAAQEAVFGRRGVEHGARSPCLDASISRRQAGNFPEGHVNLGQPWPFEAGLPAGRASSAGASRGRVFRDLHRGVSRLCLAVAHGPRTA